MCTAVDSKKQDYERVIHVFFWHLKAKYIESRSIYITNFFFVGDLYSNLNGTELRSTEIVVGDISEHG